jgi:protocatechuate 3,4-dioxygenase beta subunit
MRAEETPIVLPDDPSFGTEVQVDYPGYRSTRWRAPDRPLVTMPEELHSLDGPVFGEDALRESDDDLTRQHDGEPLGERIIVTGRVVDVDGRPIRGALVEVWQANAAGRYRHVVDQHPAPLDPNFSGAGRCLTDDDGEYRFVTVKPGSYPWGNHENAWRPAHIHFSVFGRAFTQRLVTQMYFRGDPLFSYDPIFNSVRDPRSRELLIAELDIATTKPEWALAFRWDIVLGRAARTDTAPGRVSAAVPDSQAVLHHQSAGGLRTRSSRPASRIRWSCGAGCWTAKACRSATG